MLVFPPCKINLGLFVTEKRTDGFHNLESVFIPVPLTDMLEVITAPHGTMEFTLSGNAVAGDFNENTCVRAYRLLSRDFDLPGIEAQLHKIIPSGAGLGGGSSDGASMIHVLNELFSLGLSTIQQREYAAQLGSDCPFFIEPLPSFVSGRGEFLTPLELDLSGLFICLVHPAVHVSTAEAYGLLSPRPAPFDLRELASIPRDQWTEKVSNDFEAPVSKLHPVVTTIKEKLYQQGAFYAAMSGSGSAVYGLFDRPVQLEFPGYFTWNGALAGL